MEAPIRRVAFTAHDLDARSTAIQCVRENCAPVQPRRSSSCSEASQHFPSVLHPVRHSLLVHLERFGGGDPLAGIQ